MITHNADPQNSSIAKSLNKNKKHINSFWIHCKHLNCKQNREMFCRLHWLHPIYLQNVWMNSNEELISWDFYYIINNRNFQKVHNSIITIVRRFFAVAANGIAKRRRVYKMQPLFYNISAWVGP